MKNGKLLLVLAAMLVCAAGVAFGQATGDFRSHASGFWEDDATWEQYNGATWVFPAPQIPDTLHTTTIMAGDTVVVGNDSVTYFVGNSTIQPGGVVRILCAGDTLRNLTIANGTLTVDGLLVQTGTPSAGPYSVRIASTGAIVVENGGVIQQDQNGGQIPLATWNPGSTLLVTGITTSTSMGGNGIQDYYNIVWNCPNQTANCNMGFHPSSTTTTFDTTVTVHGNMTFLSTGIANRAYLCGIRAGTALVPNNTHITINGNINVSNRAIFSSNGTSNAYTNIYVTVLGNIHVTDSASQFAISRGSQGTTGTTTWYLKGDSVVYGPKTTNQNSTDAATAITSKGKFIFCKPGTQVVQLDTLVNWTGPCNMQFGDSVTATTVLIGNSPFIGSGTVQRIKHNATVVVGTDGYIGGGNNSTPLPSNFAIDDGGTLVVASQNGIKATGTGSSGAVRVTGNRDYGTGANYVYNGSSHQRLGSGFPASVNNLTINNALGVYADSTPAFTVNGTLTVTSGHFDLNGAVVTLGPSAALSETPGNTVNGTSGYLTTTRTLTAPSSSTDIAGLGVAVGSAADLGSTVINRGHAVQAGVSIERYFDVIPTTNAGLNATLVFRYDTSELNGNSAATMALWKSTDAGASFGSQASTNDAGNHKLTATGLDSLSRYSASDADHALGAVHRILTLNPGWNMVSLPVQASDSRKALLFPTAKSQAFSYAGTYIGKDSLNFGAGYWLKYDSVRTADILGVVVTQDTFRLNKGWNMIGCVSGDVRTVTLTSIPPGLVTSSFFGYVASHYQIADTLHPGFAYWVKTSDTGRIAFNAGAAAAPKAGRIVIVASAELPPPPPDGTPAVLAPPPVPKAFALSAAWPNPFNPSTSFRVDVPEAAQLDIAVYNLLGQRIATIYSGIAAAGTTTMSWNGLNDDNMPAGGGIYFLRMTADRYSAVNKIILMK